MGLSLEAQVLVKNALQCVRVKDLDQAHTLLGKALICSPNHPDILRIKSIVTALQFDHAGALRLIDEVIALVPDDGVAHSNRGNILKELHRHEEALDSFNKAIELLPAYAEAYSNKGNVLQELQRYEEALDWYDRALALQPEYAEAYSNKGNALEWLRRHDEAMENYDRAIAINPQYVDSYWHKALSQLADGNYEFGWQNYEARWFKGNPVQFQYAQIPRLESLQNINGKSILVWAEQGLGDAFQFCRYIKILADHGANVTFVIPKALVEVLKTLSAHCSLIESLEKTSLRFDYQSPLLSLPLVCGTTANTVPNTIPYLTSDPEKVAHLAATIRKSKNLKVGLVWNGGFRADHPELWGTNQRRNIDLDLIARLKNAPGIDFYSLQKGDPAESELIIKKSVVWPNIIDNSSLLKDFSDTAALIESLDLIISVDTSTAHLAGALGKPVWILNRYDSCWRWLRGQSDSPWYPTATIYQQGSPGDWGGVIEKVKIDLSLLAKANLQKKDVY